MRLLFQIFLLVSLSTSTLLAQDFYFGADQSYVNEMEDCGAVFKENNVAKDVYSIYKDHGCNLVRLRLWHTPSWYDNLNEGRRYSDLADVKKSIARAKASDMAVLLDFHLSDNWADPSKQLVPAAWLPVVDDLPKLQDSLYNYIYATLSELADENLLPEMVQIGNETNRGILLSPEDNQTWTLDWARNAALFNKGIQAVRDVEQSEGEEIQVVIHLAGPADTDWYVENFVANQVTDFDIIGISYYWAWHKPTTIAQTGSIIEDLRSKYPGKEVLIVETGYIWTQESADAANNIISEIHPDFSPASPTNQRDWLIELAQEVIAKKGLGVIYWEPSWVSTSCSTQWGQGSHQEHATFFDFDTNLLLPGGIEWMEYDYGLLSDTEQASEEKAIDFDVRTDGSVRVVNKFGKSGWSYSVVDSLGRVVEHGKLGSGDLEVSLRTEPPGHYTLTVGQGRQVYTVSFINLK
ncbi:MAG: glycosyl hydrolase 53 family protein [Saprospiraceae bacterium]|nr:glycosyl hydrolase 53 family protein [Saprospiraceae bacterium]